MKFGPKCSKSKIRQNRVNAETLCLLIFCLKALMSGFNDKKAVDDLYESGKYIDETDSQLPQGPEEVGKLHSVI